MEKSEKSKKFKRVVFYVVLLIVIIFLAIILIRYTSRDYRAWRSHQSYISNDTSIKIRSWMTPYSVTRHFNISQDDLFNILNISNTSSDLRTPIIKICAKNKMDCPLVVNELNSWVR